MINEYIKECGYYLGDLKPYIYLLPKGNTKISYQLDLEDTINSYITSIETSGVKRLNANVVSYSSSSSFSNNFSIETTIEVTINEVRGYQFDDILNKLDGEYYILFTTNTNDRFIQSVEFPISYIYSRNIGENNNSITLSFTISQNIPSLQINDDIEIVEDEIVNDKVCSYSRYSIERYRMSNMSDTVVSNGLIAVTNNKTIKRVDIINNSLTYTETFDGTVYNYSLSFRIPLKNYTNYLNYTLLEFTKNTYACFINTSLGNAIAIPNMFPNYVIESSEDDSAFNTITITLTCSTASKIAFDSTSDDMEDIIDNNDDNDTDENKSWNALYKYDQCIDLNTKAHTLIAEYNFKGYPTGNYACLEGFIGIYQNDFNIIEEYTTEETKYGFPITYEDSSCFNDNECYMSNLPTVITFYGNETKTYVVNSSCEWNLIWDETNLWEITPTSGESGEVTLTFTYVGSEGITREAYIEFSNDSRQTITLVAVFDTMTRYVEDGTICSETPIEPSENCIKWEDIEFDENDPNSYICEGGNLYKKRRKYVSQYCDGNYEATDVYEKTELVEENSQICYNYGTIVWVEVKNEFICEEATDCQEWRDIEYNPNDSSTYICNGYNRYSKQELYKSENCESDWIGTGQYRQGELVEANSTVCGYNPPSEDTDKLSFTWGGDTKFVFKANGSRNIETTENPYSHTFAEMGIPSSANIVGRNMFNASFNTATVGKLLTFDHFPEVEKFNYGYGMFSGQDEMTVCTFPYQTVGATDFRFMFRGCSKLTKINFDGWRLNSEGYLNDSMFEGCTALTEISLKNATDIFVSMIQDALFQANLLGQVTLITK